MNCWGRTRTSIPSFSGTLFFHLLLTIKFMIILIHAAETPPYVPAEKFNFDCSSSGEYQLSFDAPLSTEDVANTSSSEDGNLGNAATKPCIFTKQFVQPFLVAPGPVFVRLHFNPSSYQDLNLSNAVFNVSIGNYTLLQTIQSSFLFNPFGNDHAVREFIVNVDSQELNITFSPSSDNPNAYAVVNKIEIVSMPSGLYIQGSPLPIIGGTSQLYTGDYRILETTYRINVGGPAIAPKHDTGMYRAWIDDIVYIDPDSAVTTTVESEVEITYSSQVPAYIAPEKVYSTGRVLVAQSDAIEGNMTWSLPVDAEFYYLVRLHFCEIRRDIEHVDIVGRSFTIYINDHIAEDHANVIGWSSTVGTPVYKDYIVNFPAPAKGIEHLQISIYTKRGLASGYTSGFLNGIEVFKLPNSSNSLAGLNPFGIYTIHDTPLKRKILVEIGAGFVVGCAILCLMCYFYFLIPSGWSRIRSHLRNKQFRLCRLSGDSCQCFSLANIKAATENFSDAFLIGTGGFGKVYKGFLAGGKTAVAIKRSNPNSPQGLREFQTEISVLSKLRHHHLVSLIGYCMADKEMILVYNYMSRGTLRDHLYKTRNPPLPWKLRLKICIGAARGLHYLHTGSKQVIIHRDVKSTNILLDDGWEAKVSDFGLSKTGPDMTRQSDAHISTMVKGSLGYLDPEYCRRLKLTEKSDVYSFGVVLFEVLCARPAILSIAGDDDDELVTLATWASKCAQEGVLDQVIDSHLKGKIDPECFITYVNTAMWCLADKGCERPSMAEILSNLELALQQQCFADKEPCYYLGNKTMVCKKTAIFIDHQPCIETSHSDLNLGSEFSEILQPCAR